MSKVIRVAQRAVVYTWYETDSLPDNWNEMDYSEKEYWLAYNAKEIEEDKDVDGPARIDEVEE